MSSLKDLQARQGLHEQFPFLVPRNPFLNKTYLIPEQDLKAILSGCQFLDKRCLHARQPQFPSPKERLPKDQFLHHLKDLQPAAKDLFPQPVTCPPLNRLNNRGYRQNPRYHPYLAPVFGHRDISKLERFLGGYTVPNTPTPGQHVAEDPSDPKQKAVFQAVPFSEGGLRVAYKGKLYSPDQSSKEIVVKKFKTKFARCKSDWALDIKTAKRASELAAKFNTVSGTDRKIKFREMIPMKVTKSTTSCKVGVGEWIVVEDFLCGHYMKWICNEGSVNRETGLFLPAFSHWTWVETDGKELVCDLQGVCDNPRGYELTDPAIHSQSQEYGAPDRGNMGIRDFFRTHKCNSFCRGLGINTKRPAHEKVCATGTNVQSLGDLLKMLNRQRFHQYYKW